MLASGYQAYRLAGLPLFPVGYLGIYWLAVRIAKGATSDPRATMTLMKHFVWSLLPIALAYHATHYFSFLVYQLRALPDLVTQALGNVSQPFGLSSREAIPMGIIWHVQVGTLLTGHMIGVWLAHQQAVRIFSDRAKAATSQIPIMTLMLSYTILGLWVISLPLGI